MSETTVHEHLRRSTAGRVGGVRRHQRRYLTTEQIAAGRGRGVGRASLSQELIHQGIDDGYAAAGPWEVERRGDRLVLLHYAFPIARALKIGSTWVVSDMQGRPGYGMSASDIEGVRLLAGTLNGSGPNGWQIKTPPVGLNPNPRLRTKKHGGTIMKLGRVSPYAVVKENPFRESFGLGPGFGPGPAFPPRRGRKVR